jgi:hypothetical protein
MWGTSSPDDKLTGDFALGVYPTTTLSVARARREDAVVQSAALL